MLDSILNWLIGALFPVVCLLILARLWLLPWLGLRRARWHGAQMRDCPNCGLKSYWEGGQPNSGKFVPWYDYSGVKLNTLACRKCGYMDEARPPARKREGHA